MGVEVTFGSGILGVLSMVAMARAPAARLAG